MKYIWDAGLTDKEYGLIGIVVAQWGALEAEIFTQTLETFGSDIHVSQLPKEMNNLNFASVLELWKERVVDVSKGKIKSVLRNAYKKILKLKEFRNSTVHGMWEFSLSDPNTICSIRVKGDRIIKIVFDDGSLSDFCTEVAQLNADIRYPGGPAQFFQEHMRDGFYVNEAALRRMKLESGKK